MPQPTATTSPRRLRRAFLNLLLLGLSVLVSVFILDAVIGRFFYFGSPIAPDRPFDYHQAPNARYTFESVPYKLHVSLNSDGFRERELPNSPFSTGKRVVFLGDSFTFGWCVEAEQSFVRLTEKMLHEADGAGAWQVLNLGVQGTAGTHYRDYLLSFGDTLRPDIVIACYYVPNDVQTWFSPPRTDLRRLRFHRKMLQLNPCHLKSLVRNVWMYWRNPSAAAGPSNNPLLPLLDSKDPLVQSRIALIDPQLLQWAKEFRIQPELVCRGIIEPDLLSAQIDMNNKAIYAAPTRTAFRQLCEAVERLGAELRVVLIPDGCTVNRDQWDDARRVGCQLREALLDDHRIQDTFMYWCEDRSIPCLDLKPFLREASGRTYLELDLHFNAFGNEVAAKAISQWLRGQLPPQSPPAPAAPSPFRSLFRWDFRKSGDRSEWKPNPPLTAEVTGGALRLVCKDDRPLITNTSVLLDSDKVNRLRIRMRSDRGYNGRFYWGAIPSDPGAEFREFTGTFRTKRGGRVRVLAACPGPVFPATVVWDNWRLTAANDETKNLIPNGSFESWPDGRHAPDGWAHGADWQTEEQRLSAISRYAGTAADGASAVQQTWRANDMADALIRLFGVSVDGLMPNTEYVLRVKASNLSGASPLLIAFEVDANDEPVERLKLPIITVSPSAQCLLSEKRMAVFPILADGVFHNYEIALDQAVADWGGSWPALVLQPAELDPMEGTMAGATVEIDSIELGYASPSSAPPNPWQDVRMARPEAEACKSWRPDVENLPDIWGEGILFGFSGLDGESNVQPGFTGMCRETPFTVLFPLPYRTWRMLTISGAPEAKVGAALNDMFAAESDEGWLTVAYTSWHSLVGILPADAKALIKTAAGVDAVWQDPFWVSEDKQRGDAVVLREQGNRFALSFGLTLDEACDRAERAIELDPLKEASKRLAVYRKMPSLETREKNRLLKKCVSVLKLNTRSPEGAIRSMWSTPAVQPYNAMWLWDSVFHSFGMNYVDPSASWQCLKSVLDTQDDSGMIPHMTRVTGETSDHTQPPILAWGIWRNYSSTKDRGCLEYALPRLERFMEWILANRDRNKNDLLEWRIDDHPVNKCGESGMDNSPRFDAGVPLDAVDFSVLAAVDMRYMSRIAEELGDAVKTQAWRKRSDSMTAKIHELLWNDEQGFYMDRDLDGRFSVVKAVTGFYPLLLEDIPDKHTNRLVQAMRDPGHFNTAFPLPTVSVSDPSWSTDMWRGPTWINTNYLVIQGLLKQGRKDAAQWLADETIAHVNTYYEKHGVVFEFYDSKDETPPPACLRKGVPETPYNPTSSYGSIRDYDWTASLVVCLLLEPLDLPSE